MHEIETVHEPAMAVRYQQEPIQQVPVCTQSQLGLERKPGRWLVVTDERVAGCARR